MGDQILGKILIALKEIDKIESLNVSKNKITCKGGSLIGELISSSSKLRVLLMQFNQVMGKGGQAIANSI